MKNLIYLGLWEWSFRDPASMIAESVVLLHNNILYYLIVTSVFTGVTIARALYLFTWQSSQNTGILYGYYLTWLSIIRKIILSNQSLRISNCLIVFKRTLVKKKWIKYKNFMKFIVLYGFFKFIGLINKYFIMLFLSSKVILLPFWPRIFFPRQSQWRRSFIIGRLDRSQIVAGKHREFNAMRAYLNSKQTKSGLVYHYGVIRPNNLSNSNDAIFHPITHTIPKGGGSDYMYLCRDSDGRKVYIDLVGLKFRISEVVNDSTLVLLEKFLNLPPITANMKAKAFEVLLTNAKTWPEEKNYVILDMTIPAKAGFTKQEICNLNMKQNLGKLSDKGQQNLSTMINTNNNIDFFN